MGNKNNNNKKSKTQERKDFYKLMEEKEKSKNAVQEVSIKNDLVEDSTEHILEQDNFDVINQNLTNSLESIFSEEKETTENKNQATEIEKTNREKQRVESLERELKERINLLREKRENIEKNLRLDMSLKSETLIAQYDLKFEELRLEIEKVVKTSEINETNSALKLTKKMWQSYKEELEQKAEGVKENLAKELQKLQKQQAKKEESIEKDYLTNQVAIKSEVKVKELNLELENKLNEIKKLTIMPKEQYDRAKQELLRLTKEFEKQKELIVDQCEDELTQKIKEHKSDKNFTKIRVTIPEEEKEAVAKQISEQGFIYQETLDKFKRASEKDLLENEYETKKAKMIEEKYEIFKKLAQEQEIIISENKKVLVEAESLQKEAIDEYNKKVDELNSSLSKISAEKDIKIEKINKVKHNDIVLKEEREIPLKSKKTIDLEEKYAKKPKKENAFFKLVNKFKESKLYKAHSEKKQMKIAKKEKIEQDKINRNKASVAGVHNEVVTMKDNLRGMVQKELNINETNKPKNRDYTEIELF